MRDMTEKEIRDFIEEWTWGTLIGVDGDKPYAIEVTYASDGEYIHSWFHARRKDGTVYQEKPERRF